jgi:hypothetical protein
LKRCITIGVFVLAIILLVFTANYALGADLLRFTSFTHASSLATKAAGSWIGVTADYADSKLGKPEKVKPFMHGSRRHYRTTDGEAFTCIFDPDGKLVTIMSTRLPGDQQKTSTVIPGVSLYSLTRQEVERTLGLPSRGLFGKHSTQNPDSRVWVYPVSFGKVTYYLSFDNVTGLLKTILISTLDSSKKMWS